MIQTPDWHSLALESDGTLWAWGSNDHGQLGNNTTNDAYSPGLVLWPVVAPSLAIAVTGKKLANGVFQLAFTNNPGARFTVLTATDVGQPLPNWLSIGGVAEPFPGQFQFSDSQAITDPKRFYIIRSP